MEVQQGVGGGGEFPVGPQPMVDSISVTVASDQTPIPVDLQESTIIITLNELVSRLSVLASMANSGIPALRIIPVAGSTVAVTGTLTSITTLTTLSSITNFGTFPAYVAAVAQGNLTAILGNINNASAN